MGTQEDLIGRVGDDMEQKLIAFGSSLSIAHRFRPSLQDVDGNGGHFKIAGEQCSRLIDQVKDSALSDAKKASIITAAEHVRELICESHELISTDLFAIKDVSTSLSAVDAISIHVAEMRSRFDDHPFVQAGRDIVETKGMERAEKVTSFKALLDQFSTKSLPQLETAVANFSGFQETHEERKKFLDILIKEFIANLEVALSSADVDDFTHDSLMRRATDMYSYINGYFSIVEMPVENFPKTLATIRDRLAAFFADMEKSFEEVRRTVL